MAGTSLHAKDDMHMDTPVPWHQIGRHGVMPEATHDDVARFNAIAGLNRFLATRIAPTVQRAYEGRAADGFRAEHGREPADRDDVAKALARDPAYQSWATLRRATMEMRQQAGRMFVLRQADRLAARAAQLEAASGRLEFDDSVAVPRYLSAVEPHLMPGGYHTELFPGDVSAAANYDSGAFATVGGGTGPYLDGGGRGLVAWLRANAPDFSPARILDLGCGVGHNTLPLAQAFPAAHVVAVDVGVPMLRYAHARAASLGVGNVAFRQADAAQLPFDSASFDLVYTSMVLHETSRDALPRILAECRRLLRDGGLTLHLEQPPYRGMGAYEQFMRDWDGRYNNEPFWSGLHQLQLPDLLVRAGFDRAQVFETKIQAPASPDADASPRTEDFGRAPLWYAAGSWKR